jgi:hypothetical protein
VPIARHCETMAEVRRLAVILVLVSAVALAPSAQGGQRLTLSFVAQLVDVHANNATAPVGKPNNGFDFDDVLVNTTTQLGKKNGAPTGWDHGTIVYLNATTLERSWVLRRCLATARSPSTL